MANPQKENGYTTIANELLEAIIKAKLESLDYKIILIVIRKTYGFRKKEDPISISQLVRYAGNSEKGIIKAIKRLESSKVIEIKRTKLGKKNLTNSIKLNKDYEDWVLNAGSGGGTVLGGKKVLNPSSDTKETLTKEILVEPQKTALDANKKTMKTYNENEFQEDVPTIREDGTTVGKPKTSKYSKGVRDEMDDFIGYFMTEHPKKIGDVVPYISKGIVYKCLAGPLKYYGLKRLKEMLDDYLSRDNRYFKENRWSILVFLSTRTLNQLEQ